MRHFRRRDTWGYGTFRYSRLLHLSWLTTYLLLKTCSRENREKMLLFFFDCVCVFVSSDNDYFICPLLFYR
jgi:hypothetical protein